MTEAVQIAEALPNLPNANRVLDAYLSERRRPLGKFKPENYFNNTKAEFLNIKTDDLRAVVRALKKKKGEKSFKAFTNFLWNSGTFEKMSIAAECYALMDLKFEDFKSIVQNIDNWAHNDSFSTRVSGVYLHKHPEEIEKLIPFAKSSNLWERRFASVSLILILKDNSMSHKKALKVLDILMKDEHPDVMKTTDWMIRVLLAKNYDEGFSYMKKWAEYYRKNNDRNVRWVLVRARHKLHDKEKSELEKMIDF